MADPTRTQSVQNTGAKQARQAELRRLARPALAGPQAFAQLPAMQAELLELQRAAGNQAVSGILNCFVEPGQEQQGGESRLAQSQAVGESLWARRRSRTPEGSASIAVPTAQGESLWAQHNNGGGGAVGGSGTDAAALPGEAIWASESSADSLVAPLASLWAASAPGIPPALAVVGPVAKALNVVQNVNTFNGFRLGVTTFATGSKAPSYNSSINSKKNKKGVVEFYAHPKWGSKAFEGNSQAFYIDSGWHKTVHVEAGAPVFWYMSPAMSSRDRDAEAEHSNDIKHAYKISLKEAHNILDSHIIGKAFGPAASKADAENKVKAAIKKKLAHPRLGDDQTMWAAKYTLLQQKTLTRDKSKWHTFSLESRKEVKNKKGVVQKVTYRIKKGSTLINVVKSSKLIKY